MSSQRDLRSNQPNVTRSASKNSFVARSTVINHDRLSRDNSPARKKSNKKPVRKPATTEASSNLTSSANSLRSPPTSRDGSTESRRSTRSREASEDRKPNPSETSVTEILPTKKNVGRQIKTHSDKTLLTTGKRLVPAKGSALSSSSVKPVSHRKLQKGARATKTKYFKKNRTFRRRKLFRSNNGRFAQNASSVPADRKCDSTRSDSRANSSNKITYFRKSGRLRSPSPPKGFSGDFENLGDITRPGTNQNWDEGTTLPSQNVKCEQLRHLSPNVPSEKPGQTGRKPKTTRKCTADIVQSPKSGTVIKGDQPAENSSERVNRSQKTSITTCTLAKDLVSEESIKARKTRGHSGANAAHTKAMDSQKALIPNLPANALAEKGDLDSVLRSDLQQKLSGREHNLKIKSGANAQCTSAKKPDLDVEVKSEASDDGESLISSFQDAQESSALSGFAFKEKKSLKRELSNLSFSNPGRVLAATLDVSKGVLNERGKYLRLHSNISYFSKKNIKKQVASKLGMKTESASVSNLRLWKEKQSSRKRKALPSSFEDNVCTKKMTLVKRGTCMFAPSTATYTNIHDATDVKTQELTNSPPGVPGAALDTPQSEHVAQKSGILAVQGVQVKRKRGRPPKSKPVVESGSQPYEEPVHKDAIPFSKEVGVGTSDLSVPNVSSGQMPLKKKKRKRRRFKGCLDASFKAKKKSTKHTRGSSQSVVQAVKTVKPIQSSPPKPEIKATSLNFKDSFSDDSFHQEHSYAKSSRSETLFKNSPPKFGANEDAQVLQYNEKTSDTKNSEQCSQQSNVSGEDSMVEISGGVTDYELTPNSLKSAKPEENPTCIQVHLSTEENANETVHEKETRIETKKPHCSFECVENPKTVMVDILTGTALTIHNKESSGHLDESHSTNINTVCTANEKLTSASAAAIENKTLESHSNINLDGHLLATRQPHSFVETGNKEEIVPETSDHFDTHSFTTTVADNQLLAKSESHSSVERGNKVETVPETLNSDKHSDECSFSITVAEVESAESSKELNVGDSAARCDSNQLSEMKTLSSPEPEACDPVPNPEDKPVQEKCSSDAEVLQHKEIKTTDEISKVSSPLAVVVGDWEDNEAPPMLTPVKTTSPLLLFSPDRDNSPERTSPPILLASNVSLSPLASRHLKTTETTNPVSERVENMPSASQDLCIPSVACVEQSKGSEEILLKRSDDHIGKNKDPLPEIERDVIDGSDKTLAEIPRKDFCPPQLDPALTGKEPTKVISNPEKPCELEEGFDSPIATTHEEPPDTQSGSSSRQCNTQKDCFEPESMVDGFVKKICQDEIMQPSTNVSQRKDENNTPSEVVEEFCPAPEQEGSTDGQSCLVDPQVEATEVQPSSDSSSIILQLESKVTETDVDHLQQETSNADNIDGPASPSFQEDADSFSELVPSLTQEESASNKETTDVEIMPFPFQAIDKKENKEKDFNEPLSSQKMPEDYTSSESTVVPPTSLTENEIQKISVAKCLSTGLKDNIADNSLSPKESAATQDPQVPFKRPRGRPRKIKGGKLKAGKPNATPPVKPKTKLKTDPEKDKTPKQLPPSRRTFALRPQISRSPLENIALRFGGEEAYSSLKKKSRTSANPLNVCTYGLNYKETSATLDKQRDLSAITELKQQCKPCSVVLTDFVKQLNLDSIDSSEDSDSDSEYCDLQKNGDLHDQSPSFQGHQSSLQLSQDINEALQQTKKTETSLNNSFSKENEEDILATEILEMFANYKCKYCNYCSESSQLMEEHIFIHKDFFKCYPISCLNCPKRFPDHTGFDEHHVQYHSLQEKKYEEIDTIVEKDHYQIVLRDGSTIDLKTADTEGGYFCQLGESSVNPLKEMREENNTPDEQLEEKSEQISEVPAQLGFPSNPDLLLEKASVLESFPNKLPNTEESESILWVDDAEVAGVMQSILDELENFGETGLGFTDVSFNQNVGNTVKEYVTEEQLASSTKILSSEECDKEESFQVETRTKLSLDDSDKPASPITVLLSTDGLTDSTEEQTFDENKMVIDPVNLATTTDTISAPEDHPLQDKTNEKVDPVVEKLRKIVRSVPQTRSYSKVPENTASISESCKSSVLVQAEQGGKKESSVIDTSTSSAPVIISFVVSGNVEVTTPDAQAAVARVGSSVTSNKFTCTYCMHGSDDRSRMVEHVAQMHPDETQFTCCICDKAFSSNMSVISQHIRNCHPGQDEQKMCKPLPGFYAVDELLEHNSVRSKTSDNIFEMFNSAADGSSVTSEKNEPLRQHFRKARDVMHFREKAKRQAEADSTTSGTGEETNITHLNETAPHEELMEESTENIAVVQNSRDPTENTTGFEESECDKVSMDPSASAQKKVLEPSSTAVLEDDTNTVSSSEKQMSEELGTTDLAPCSPVAVDGETEQAECNQEARTEDDQASDAEDDQVNEPEDSQGEIAKDILTEPEGDTMLKIVSVVSLKGLGSSPTKADMQSYLSNKNSGEITREAARSAVSALFKSSPKQCVYDEPTCKQCEENLSSMQDLYCHLQNMHDLACFYSCPLCPNHLRNTAEGVREHMSQEHGTTDCSISLHVVAENYSETKTTEGVLPDHVPTESEASSPPQTKTATPSTGMQCKHCASNHTSAGALLEHLESLHGENCLLVCPYCKKAISKEEADVYDHIGTQHKNYDSFVPLLLVSNRAPPSSKLSSKQSLAISESRRLMFASKTLQASSVPISDKSTRNDETSCGLSDSDTPQIDIGSVMSSGSANTSLTTSESVSPSPLAMLKKTTSSILVQAASEAAAVLRPAEATVNTYSTVLSVCPALVAKRNIPILPKPDLQVTTHSICPRPFVPQTLSPKSSNLRSSSVQDMREKPKPIVPRGIKHVEKRPVKELAMLNRITPSPAVPPQGNMYRPPTAPPQLSHIPPVQPAIAIATTVTRPLLRIPSVIPSPAGKSPQPRPTSGGGPVDFSGPSAAQGQSSSHALVSGSSPKLTTNLVPTMTAGDAPLDLSCSGGAHQKKEPEEDIDPDAFNVFNLCPSKDTKPDTQPLNLSVRVGHNLEQSAMQVRYRAAVQNMLSRAPSNMPRIPVNMMSGYPRTPSAYTPPSAYTTPSTSLNRTPLQMRYSPQAQMNVRYAGNNGMRMGTPPAGVRAQHMVQSGYQPRHRNIPAAQSHVVPQSRQVMGQQFQGRMMHADISSQRQPSRQSNMLACPSCDFHTATSASMKAHITNIHKARYRCPYCPHLVQLTQRDVAYHIAQQHPGRNVMYFNL